jgi:hypothetical protein
MTNSLWNASACVMLLPCCPAENQRKHPPQLPALQHCITLLTQQHMHVQLLTAEAQHTSCPLPEVKAKHSSSKQAQPVQHFRHHVIACCTSTRHQQSVVQ